MNDDGEEEIDNPLETTEEFHENDVRYSAFINRQKQQLNSSWKDVFFPPPLALQYENMDLYKKQFHFPVVNEEHIWIDIVLQGFLLKQSRWIKRWRKRFFQLLQVTVYAPMVDSKQKDVGEEIHDMPSTWYQFHYLYCWKTDKLNEPFHEVINLNCCERFMITIPNKILPRSISTTTPTISPIASTPTSSAAFAAALPPSSSTSLTPSLTTPAPPPQQHRFLIFPTYPMYFQTYDPRFTHMMILLKNYLKAFTRRDYEKWIAAIRQAATFYYLTNEVAPSILDDSVPAGQKQQQVKVTNHGVEGAEEPIGGRRMSRTNSFTGGDTFIRRMSMSRVAPRVTITSMDQYTFTEVIERRATLTDYN
jgi:hypothetical protein